MDSPQSIGLLKVGLQLIIMLCFELTSVGNRYTGRYIEKSGSDTARSAHGRFRQPGFLALCGVAGVRHRHGATACISRRKTPKISRYLTLPCMSLLHLLRCSIWNILLDFYSYISIRITTFAVFWVFAWTGQCPDAATRCKLT